MSKGGKEVKLPFWKNLSGDDEILDDSSDLSVGKIEADADNACILVRGKAWAVNDLANLFAGDNAMEAIAEKTADYWATQKQEVLISTLKGIFGSALSSHVLDISSESGTASIISAKALIEAEGKMGDNYDNLAGIMCNSAVMTKLRQLDLIDTIPDSEGKRTIPTYLGLPVIVDDSLKATEAGVQTVYLFGNGAITYKEGNGVRNIELDRDSLGGDDIYITRHQFVMHPNGVKWKGTPAKATASNAELATAGNWELVDDAKNVPIVCLKCRTVSAT